MLNAVMEVDSFTEIIQKADYLTKEPENYLSGREEYTSEIRELTKKFYDFNKYNESENNPDILDELVLGELDEEQIWQQIELQNNFLYQKFVSDIAQFLVEKNYLNFGNDVDINKLEGKNKDADGYESSSSREKSGDDFEDEEEDGSVDHLGSESDKDNQSLGNDDGDVEISKTSIVDDKFFKLSEMEKFLEIEESNNNVNNEDDEDSIDYFENFSDSDDEEERPVYDDFFDQPEDGLLKRKRRKKPKDSENVNDFPTKKKVKFELGNIAPKEYEINDFSDSEEENDENQLLSKKNSDSISTFEARQERLKSRIRALEEEALKDKPWQLKGEVTASNRPQNSLLEEIVEFDTSVRPPPVITEKTTLKLEDIIKQRIKDKAWDDVERKIKPVEDPREYRKRLVLDQEKSKLSLAQIYEQEYLKKKEAMTQNAEDRPEEVPNEHVEIDKMMKSLFSKLDALSNFHFTPKMVTTEVKIVSNLPAVTVEEVAPVGTSDAALLAPEEIKPKMKGDLIGKTERTKTDKKRERRKKKKKQRMRRKATEDGEKAKVDKLKDDRKSNKKASSKLLKKLGQNVSYANENGNDKYVRSSSAFFTRLQDEVRTQIKKKSGDVNKYEKHKKLDIKKLKL